MKGKRADSSGLEHLGCDGVLNETKLTIYLRRCSKRKTILGICLGMQLLFEESDENGVTKGLGLLKGKVVRIPGMTAKDRHIKFRIWAGISFRFHQHHCFLKESVKIMFTLFIRIMLKQMIKTCLLATSPYDVEVPAVVGKDNVFGMQFHPEKSSATRNAIAENYANLVEEKEPSYEQI